ncbi:hypothetical protein GOODEAATRI_014681, partial [Goodea atripinnis]
VANTGVKVCITCQQSYPISRARASCLLVTMWSERTALIAHRSFGKRLNMSQSMSDLMSLCCCWHICPCFCYRASPAKEL